MAEEQQEDTRKSKSFIQKVVIFIGIALFITIILGFIFGIYFFGITGIFNLFGIQYSSVWSLFIFVVSFFILAAIVELITDPIAYLLMENIPSRWGAFLIRFIIGTLTNAFCLFVIDFIMDSITLTLEIGIVVASIITLIELALEGDKKKKDK